MPQRKIVLPRINSIEAIPLSQPLNIQVISTSQMSQLVNELNILKQIYIYLQQYQLRMTSAVPFRLTSLTERKCNFCFEWCESALPVTAPLLCCDSCYSNFQYAGYELQTAKGEFYGLQLIQLINRAESEVEALKKNIESLVNYDIQQTYLRWSRIQSVFDDNDYNNEEIQAIQERIEEFHRECEEETENLMVQLQNVGHRKNNKSFIISTEESLDKGYKSFVQNKENPRKGRKSDVLKQVGPALLTNRLQDYCQNLGATRFIKKYQYYYNSSELKRYKEDTKPQKTRQFGAQLSPNHFSQIGSNKQHSSKKLDIPRLRFNRSTSSQFSGVFKLSEEELKARIVAFLEGKSQSVTMNRLMATYVREAYIRTNLQMSMIQLVSFKISSMDLLCYFNLFDLDSVTTLKLINVGLTDSQLRAILDLIGSKNIERLVLTGNALTEQVLPCFLSRTLPNLREIYLGKNRINKYRVKENITELRTRFVLYL